MAKQDSIYTSLGWVVAIATGIIFFIYLSVSNNNDNSSNPVSADAKVQSSKSTTSQTVSSESNSSWKCVDATSYNRNAFDDNKCTNGNETRYVSDSQAKSLDPNYLPGKAGATYYNNQ